MEVQIFCLSELVTSYRVPNHDTPKNLNLNLKDNNTDSESQKDLNVAQNCE